MQRAVIAAVVVVAAMVCVLAGFVVAVERSFQSQGVTPIGPEDRTAVVDGLRIRYRQRGAEPPQALLLHGFASRLEFWNGLAPQLDCASSVAPDLLGFGGSDRPNISYDLATQARYLAAFMDSLGARQAVLVGQSMGSSLAIWMAAHYPDRVRALVLFAPSGLPGSLHYDGFHGRLVRPGALTSAASGLVRIPFVRARLGNSLALQGLTLAASYDSTFADAVRSVRQPTLLIWSEGDPVVPVGYATQYKSLMPQAEIEILPAAAGHGGPLWKPEITARRICSFLDRVAPTHDHMEQRPR